MVNVVRSLKLSKGAAFYRKTAAELLQRYPELIEPLRDGRLCITSVVELAKVITPENRGEVVARFFHSSKQEAKAISAELKPAEAAPRRDVVTMAQPTPPAAAAQPIMATPRPEAGTQRATAGREGWLDEPRTGGQPPVTSPPPAPARPVARPDEAEPLTGELRRLHVTVSRRFLAKLDAAREALSHSHPGRGTEEVLEAALDLLLAAQDKKRGLVKKPRTSPARPSSRPRHIPAEVKRAVWTRDKGCCQWKLASGGICGSRTRVQLDHIVPIALGGTSTIGNVRVLCQAHNLLAARQVYGDRWMDRFTARPGGHASRERPPSAGLLLAPADEPSP
jgi:HNH endonuclease